MAAKAGGQGHHWVGVGVLHAAKGCISVASPECKGAEGVCLCLPVLPHAGLAGVCLPEPASEQGAKLGCPPGKQWLRQSWGTLPPLPHRGAAATCSQALATVVNGLLLGLNGRPGTGNA